MATTSDSVTSLTETKVSKKPARAPEPPKPNAEEYYAKIRIEKQAIEVLSKNLTELGNRIKEHRKGQVEYNNQRNALRKDLDAITRQVQDLEAERMRIFAQIDETQKTGRDMKTKVQAMKRSLGFQSEEEIDNQIQMLERAMMGRSMSVQEENKLIAAIKQLQNSKPLVGKYAHLEADAVTHSNTAVGPLRDRRDKIRDELRVCQQTKRDLHDKLRELMADHQKALSPLKDLNEEREILTKQIATHRQEEARLSEELAQRSRLHEAWVAQLQRENVEKRREEKKRRDADNERELLQRKLEDIDEEHWTPEFQLTQQTVIYLRKLEERMRGSTPSEKAAAENTKENHILKCDEDLVAILPKGQREEEYYFAPKKKADKKVKKHAVSLTQPLVHDITTLADFERLGVNPPLSLEECPACLKLMEEKLDVLKSEQQKRASSSIQKKKELLARLEELEGKFAEASVLKPKTVVTAES